MAGLHKHILDFIFFLFFSRKHISLLIIIYNHNPASMINYICLQSKEPSNTFLAFAGWIYTTRRMEFWQAELVFLTGKYKNDVHFEDFVDIFSTQIFIYWRQCHLYKEECIITLKRGKWISRYWKYEECP